ncbi:hypothetical protein D9613_000295 [Agrocybe pediades]|uniref:Zinc-finger domain-containing protein n=1 Tax=Agrocybe pediades TaxID=84607 RepID=A0A8H4R0D6_9AGAR|nr:hypothetical protein D9613_000295 [Agrocybe pediades]
MSNDPVSNTSLNRINKAYVQVPPSPLTYLPLNTPVHVVTSPRLKENTPLRSLQNATMSSHATSSVSAKRKASDREPSSLVFDGVNPSLSAKKSKLSASAVTNATPLKTKQTPQTTAPAPNACPEFPNGWTYCHQCNKKRDLTTTIRCTVVDKVKTAKDNSLRERQCVNKYCKPCLRNRYNEDFDVLKQRQGKNGATTAFKCPRCMGICNCPRCRKSQGLEAIGALPKQKTKPAKEPSNESKISKKSKVEIVLTSRPKEKEEVKKISRPLPKLKWDSVPVALTQEQVDERILIREFLLRFSELLDPPIAKMNLEELEFIGGKSRRNEDEDDANIWVSEACVKSILTGLLGLLAKDQPMDVAKTIKSTIRELRSVGGSLNKMWACLSTLRTELANPRASESSATTSQTSNNEPPLTFPDPLPPPLSTVANLRSLRSLQPTTDAVNVLHTTQMIPVILSLIHSSLSSATIREDIDQSMKDSKDFARDAKEATKLENERWEKDRVGMDNPTKNKNKTMENKAKRETHRTQILHIESCLKIVSKSFLPRFQALGTDDDGRTYYALSPGVAERDAAFEYLECASSEKPMKPKKKGRTVSEEDRSEMREWTWFVAVWGKRPPLTPAEQKAKEEEKAHRMSVDGDEDRSEDEDSDDSEDDDADVEKWWGFWDPEEISKLAEWISIKSGIDEEVQVSDKQSGSISSKTNGHHVPLSPRQEQLKRLVVELNDYATLLQWRVREDKSHLASRSPRVEDVKSGERSQKGSPAEAIPPSRFY